MLPRSLIRQQSTGVNCYFLIVQLHMEEESGRFIVDDGSQNPITLISPSREVIAAIFYTFVQRNIGMFTTPLKTEQQS